MFNDLNQNNQLAKQNPPVDDIFDETDKSSETKSFSGYYNQTPPTLSAVTPELETVKAGLSANNNVAPAKGKALKVILIALLIILFIGLSYLVYVKFFTNQESTVYTDPAPIINIDNSAEIQKSGEEVNIATQTPVVSEENIATSTLVVTTTPVVSDTDGDGLTDEEELILGTNINLTDSDSDGLLDADEAKFYNTKANLSDTDGDGLSDYEEIKIYKTDPTKVDSDMDGYNDKVEIDGGYNPLGSGKLSEIN